MKDAEVTLSTADRLRLLADLIDAHPDLPQPYISAYSSGTIDASWYLHTRGLKLAVQKATAAKVVSTLGGPWDKRERDTDFIFTQRRDEVTLEVVVVREAVCKRVVVGAHVVTVPATPARPAIDALPETTETVEDVKWVCSSLLAW